MNLFEKAVNIFRKEGPVSVIMVFIRKYERIFIFRVLNKLIPVRNNRIMFLNFSGNYECNPRAICNELLKRNKDIKIYWSTLRDSHLEDFPEGVNLIRRNKIRFAFLLCSARVIVDNGIVLSFMDYPKKKNQILIETWHGSLGIKKFSKETNKDKMWVIKATREGLMTDIALSNSTFETTEVYRPTFWDKCQIMECGHPRNDIFFNLTDSEKDDIKKKICLKYRIPADAKLCMYAPTFRESKTFENYNIDYQGLKRALENKFGGSWVILLRLHWRLRREIHLQEFESFVFDVSSYSDIQDLSSIIDVGITDYSSWICEYLLRRKPGFFYAKDIDDFQETDREFFFPLSEYPFPFAKTNDELLSVIKNFDEEKYKDDCNAFLKRMGSIDDGKASERVVDKIVGLMEV